MNGKAFLAAAVTVMAAASCAKEYQSMEPASEEVKLVPVSIVVGLDVDGTKTSFNASTFKQTWDPGDSIAVAKCVGNNDTTYILKTVSGGNPAIFTGSLPPEVTKFRAFYPVSAIVDVRSTSNFRFEYSQTQKGVLNGVAPDAIVMGACTESIKDSLIFHPGCALAKVSVAGTDVASITLDVVSDTTSSADNGYLWAPLINFGCANLNTSTSKGSSSATMVPQTGNTFAPGDYYFTILAKSTFDRRFNSITITYTKQDNSKWVRSSSNKLTVKRAKVYTIPGTENDCSKVTAKEAKIVVNNAAPIALTKISDGVFEGKIAAPDTGSFYVTLDGVKYGFATYSGAGGIGTCNNKKSSLPYANLIATTSKRSYTVARAMGTISAMDDGGNAFWINCAEPCSLNVKVDAGQNHYYFEKVQQKAANVILDETFDLLTYGGDYMAPCAGIIAPSDPWGIGTTGSETNTPQFNGAKYDGTSIVAAGSPTALTLDHIKAWDVEQWYGEGCIGYRPLHIQFGASKSKAHMYTPKFAALTASSNVKVSMDICRFAAGTTNDFFIKVDGNGQISSGSMTVDGKTDPSAWTGLPLTEVKLVDNEYFAHTNSSADVDKPITHCTFEISGADKDTRLLLHTNEKNGRFQIFNLKVEKL